MKVRNDSLIEALILDPKYYISIDGKISTIKTSAKGINKLGIWRSAEILNSKYSRIAYGKPRRFLLSHRIVYRKYIGPLNHDLVINHKNGNKLDNSPGNLELITISENCKHSFRVLKNPPNKNGKINKEIADKIRKDSFSNFLTRKELSEKYNLTQSNISYIINNKIWL